MLVGSSRGGVSKRPELHTGAMQRDVFNLPLCLDKDLCIPQELATKRTARIIF